MESDSSTADICTRMEGKLNLQDISKSITGLEKPCSEALQEIPNSDYMDLDRLEANNLDVRQSPQPYLADVATNGCLDNVQPISPVSSPINEREAENPINAQGSHLLDEDIFEESISSEYNSCSTGNAETSESNTREGKIIAESLSKINWARCHPHTRLLAQYFAKGKEIPPKKEYLRITVIRSHKKLLRYIKENKPLCKVIKGLDRNSYTVIELVEELKIHFSNNEEVFEQIAKTESGPKTDGSKKNKNAKCKSWNNKFVKEYFENPVVLESFLLYVELIFEGWDIDLLSQRIKVQCCKSNSHSPECDEKWAIMKNFLSEKMITDLGISVPRATNNENILTGVELIPGRQGFGSENIDSYLESNQENKLN